MERIRTLILKPLGFARVREGVRYGHVLPPMGARTGVNK
jgi:hypothetical protein